MAKRININDLVLSNLLHCVNFWVWEDYTKGKKTEVQYLQHPDKTLKVQNFGIHLGNKHAGLALTSA